MRNAKVLASTGQVLEFGAIDYPSTPGWDDETMDSVAVSEESERPIVDGVELPLKYTKVVDGWFVEMSAADKSAVDEVTITFEIHRGAAVAEQTNANGGTDANSGWMSLIGGEKRTPPLAGGDWRFAITLELALVAAATWGPSGPDRGAQCRVLWNGNEVLGWLQPLHSYTAVSAAVGMALAEGVRPTLDIQLRRFGTAGTARARRLHYEFAPNEPASPI
jgi:hypothetical protein